MKIVDKITKDDLIELSKKMYGNLVKAVVDIEKEILVVDSDLHSDEESFLLEKGSQQNDLWGINLYPEKVDDDFIEFDSIINLRPSLGNSSRSVDSKDLREKIVKIVKSKIV